MNITTDQKITELRRLYDYWIKIYKKWIDNGIVDNHLANFRLSILESILKDYELKAKINQNQMFERNYQ